MINIIFIYSDIEKLNQYESIYDYIIENKLDEDVLGDHWIESIETINALYNLLELDTTELKFLLEKENFSVYGTCNQLKDRISKLTSEEIKELSVKWTNKSYPEDQNAFDICGSLFGIQNYMMNSKDKNQDLLLVFDNE